MKNTLLVLTALALSLAGCTLMETRPGSPTGGAEPGGPVPNAPPPQVIPDRGTVPPVPASTHIVVGLCPETGAYAAMGVDIQARKFTFLISGGEATRQQAFKQFYGAKIPVTVYTGITQLRTSTPNKGGPGFNPCLGFESGVTHIGSSSTVVAQVTEDPPPSPKPTGGDLTNLEAFTALSWRTAFALDTVEHQPLGGSSVF